MTTEFMMLLGAVALYFLLSLGPAVAALVQNGFFKLLGSRDDVAPRSGKSARADRALANHGEALMMFAPVVLVADALGVQTDLTKLGAEVFLGGRVAHAICYLLGIPVVRSLSYTAGMVGIGMIAYEVISRTVL